MKADPSTTQREDKLRRNREAAKRMRERKRIKNGQKEKFFTRLAAQYKESLFEIRTLQARVTELETLLANPRPQGTAREDFVGSLLV